MDQLVDERTQAPPIHCLAMPFFFNHLWSQILRSSTDRKGIVVCEYVVLRQSKVGQFDVPISTDQYVLRLQT